VRTPWEAGVFLYREDRLLLMHRAEDRYWHVVAGVVEYGEDIGDAARRELREESGLVGVDLIDLGSPVTYPITPELRRRYDYPADVREVTAYSRGSPLASALAGGS
jgi:8-oxo-dGTP pyrophosphatase MutT (NUDIX family)